HGAPIILIVLPLDKSGTLQSINSETHAAGCTEQISHQIALRHFVGWPGAPESGKNIKSCPRDAELVEFHLQGRIDVLHDAPGAPDHLHWRQIVVRALSLPLSDNYVYMVFTPHPA